VKLTVDPWRRRDGERYCPSFALLIVRQIKPAVIVDAIMAKETVARRSMMRRRCWRNRWHHRRCHHLSGTAGLIRGMLSSGVSSRAGMKVGDIDPRLERGYCYEISDKARATCDGSWKPSSPHLLI
jgi:hypothetical protein